MTAQPEEKKPSSDAAKPAPSGDAPPLKKPEPNPDDDLSEEDRALKDKLDLLAQRAMESDPTLQKQALEMIRTEIRSATSSMTSVPKPLKFLRPHFAPLKTYYATSMPDGENRVFLADILSVLAMTMGNPDKCESLRFKMRGSKEPPHLWGHEYVRHLAGEIAHEYRSASMGDVAMRDAADDAADAADADKKEDAAETAASVPELKLDPASIDEIARIVRDIIPFLISSNAEPEAVDLLMEVEALPELVAHADEHNYARVCLYLKSCTDYVSELDDVRQLLKIAADIYLKVNKLPDAMQVALRTNDLELITSIYQKSAEGSTVRLQLAFDLGRAGILLDEDIEPDFEVRAAMSNRKLSAQYLSLAKDLDVVEAKTPEDIYKSHLLDSRAPASASVDSARANLAKTFVNAFVNMGFCEDKLMLEKDGGWIYRNTEHGLMSAAASVGMIMLWDVDESLNAIDRYLHVEQDNIRAGAYLAFGLVSANVRHEVDPALALLAEHVTSDKPIIAHGAICGLGIAYAGTQREEIKEMLVPLLVDEATPSDTVSFVALALGLTFIGSADEDLSASLQHALSSRKESDDSTKEPLLHILLPLALGFVYLGHQETCEVILETIDATVGQDSMMGAIASITLEACAYCGSGSVLMFQKFLSICGEHPGNEAAEAAAAAALASSTPAAGADGATAADANRGADSSSSGAASGGGNGATGGSGSGSGDAARGNNSRGAAASGSSTGAQTGADTAADSPKVQIRTAQQAIAVLGLSMISMGEELGAEMVIRVFGHLMQYGDPVIRRTVPLAVGLLSMSHPKMTLMDMLSKFTHDSDMEVAQSSIVGLGLIGAGTNNSRIAGTLRQLSVYYSKEASSLFLVRIAQGLLHSGKGLITMNPMCGEGFLQNRNAVGGLLTVLFSCLQMKGTILGKNHFLLYFLSLASRPRMVYAVDDKMEFKQVAVRVGQAVDTVGQAGRPKSITGFQTHTTPVLLSAGERAEIATEQYLTVAATMEGTVVIEKNPDWVDESGLLDKAVAAAEQAQAEAIADATAAMDAEAKAKAKAKATESSGAGAAAAADSSSSAGLAGDAAGGSEEPKTS